MNDALHVYNAQMHSDQLCLEKSLITECFPSPLSIEINFLTFSCFHLCLQYFQVNDHS